jgi:hypothetical protein
VFFLRVVCCSIFMTNLAVLLCKPTKARSGIWFREPTWVGQPTKGFSTGIEKRNMIEAHVGSGSVRENE